MYCDKYQFCHVTLERQSIYALMISRPADLKCRLDAFRFSIDFLDSNMITKWIMPINVDMPKCDICEVRMLYPKMLKVDYKKLLEAGYNLYRHVGYNLKIDWIMDRRMYVNRNMT